MVIDRKKTELLTFSFQHPIGLISSGEYISKIRPTISNEQATNQKEIVYQYDDILKCLSGPGTLEFNQPIN